MVRKTYPKLDAGVVGRLRRESPSEKTVPSDVNAVRDKPVWKVENQVEACGKADCHALNTLT